jgi:aryl-alcohol dehydrogenase-like predicted oxidoreductase
MNIDRQGLEKLETAVRFSAFTSGVSCAIAGTHREEHLLQILLAEKKGALPEDLYRHIRTAFHSNDPGWWVGEV